MIGNGIMTGYFDQHSGEISSEKRVEEYFGECFPKLTEKKNVRFWESIYFVHKKQI